MNKKNLSLAIVMTLFIFSCGPSHKVTSSWVNPQAKAAGKKYSTLFIAALTDNQSAKNIIEADLEKAAQARGFKTFKSSDVFAPNFSKQNAPDKQVILTKVRQLGCDAILTAALVDKQSETRYTPGTTTYMPYGRHGGYGFGGYYGYMYPTLYSTPGYYTTSKTFFIDTHAVDGAFKHMVWSGQSQAYGPLTIPALSSDATSVLADQFVRDLKPR